MSGSANSRLQFNKPSNAVSPAVNGSRKAHARDSRRFAYSSHADIRGARDRLRRAIPRSDSYGTFRHICPPVIPVSGPMLSGHLCATGHVSRGMDEPADELGFVARRQDPQHRLNRPAYARLDVIF